MLIARQVPADDLAARLEAICRSLEEVLAADQANVAEQFVQEGLRRLRSTPSVVPTFLSPEHPLAPLARQYLDALLHGDLRAACDMILSAAYEGMPIRDIYLHVFQRSQHEIGRLWQINQITVAEEQLCTGVTQQIMSRLHSPAFEAPRKNRRLVTVRVAGDLHEVGMRMLTDFFQMAGWDTISLGPDVPTASLVQNVVHRQPHVLAISATLLVQLGAVVELIAAVRGHPECQNICVLVGGHLFNSSRDLWRDVDADGYAADALRAIEFADQLMQEAGHEPYRPEVWDHAPERPLLQGFAASSR